MSATIAPSNPVTCGNCGTENPADQDFCVECGQPLTGSAEQGIRENLDAQDDPSIFGGAGTPAGGVVVGGLGGAAVAPLIPGGDADPGQAPRD